VPSSIAKLTHHATGIDLPGVDEMLSAAVERRGQPRRAAADGAGVRAALHGGEHLAVQPAPALASRWPTWCGHPARHGERHTVVISTATLPCNAAVDRDLPRLAEALAPCWPQATFAILKGRRNYCACTG